MNTHANKQTDRDADHHALPLSLLVVDGFNRFGLSCSDGFFNGTVLQPADCERVERLSGCPRIKMEIVAADSLPLSTRVFLHRDFLCDLPEARYIDALRLVNSLKVQCLTSASHQEEKR